MGTCSSLQKISGCPTLRAFCEGWDPRVSRIPPFAKNAKDPNFLYAAPTRTPCAAFIKESRMKFVGSPKLNRQFGFWGTRRFVAVSKTSMRAPFHAPAGRRNRWSTDKKQTSCSSVHGAEGLDLSP